ncbi:MAG: TetR/AcrR family transcriptional regulator [Spirochaetales bacterium]|jgi:AcrR family transcriptional regulator|nr:TetR/AcrR family transcriptional regulator [Spirochaetales bacterium]
MNSDEIKNNILQAAVHLFSEKGYDGVSIMDIAKAVGCSPADIYNYCSSKSDIMNSIYDFFEQTLRKAGPNLEELLKLAETEDPEKVLMMTNFHYTPETQPLMDKIIIIASVECRRDRKSQDLLDRSIFDLPRRFTRPLLEKMIRLGRIEPLDIEAFVILQANYCYSAAIRNLGFKPITLEEWYRGQKLLYRLIKPIKQKGRSIS